MFKCFVSCSFGKKGTGTVAKMIRGTETVTVAEMTGTETGREAGEKELREG